MAHPDSTALTSRRVFLVGAAGAVLAAGAGAAPARATPASMAAAVKKVVGGAPVRKGKVTLDLPPIVENGNTVAMEVSVESPMTLEDHVKAIYVFNEKNPQPYVISAQLGPRSGQARLATRIRLADSQVVTAIAEMSDGTFWSDEVEVIVTIAACLEDLP
jgi:sulfur-oxidizing protein SoxY